MVFSTLSLFCDLLTCSGKCWLCGKSDHVAAELRVQQSKCLALLLGGLWVPRIPRGCEGYEVRHQILQKLWGTRKLRENGLRGSPGLGRGPIALSGPLGPIAPSRPDRGPTQSGPVNYTKLASPSFAIDTVAIRRLWKTSVEQ